MIRMLSILISLYISIGTNCFAIAPADNVSTPQYELHIQPGRLADFFKWHPARIPLVSHHRGGPVPGFPENAIETMDHALKYGPGLMEVDVAQLSDGTLILMHDDSLDRTTTGTGKLASLKVDDIKRLYLRDETGMVTKYKVPTLKQALLWTKNRAVLTLDIKRGVSFTNVAAEVMDAGVQDYVVAITYSVKQAQAYHEIAPNMPLTISMSNEQDIEAVKNSGIPSHLIIAWTGLKRLSSEFYRQVHMEGWRVIMGTLGQEGISLDSQFMLSSDEDGYVELYNQGVDIIATDRYQVVQEQIRKYLFPPNIFMFIKAPNYLKQSN
ncbi:glycerophosphodiester phosphodiesterase family protein [Kordiimonas pumila]|uniref:Glycerophosphodiester phosphodiesterase family protein n=1 Tax=Kordiimonas pumila TaxID=2161677 RepID=A0ABV7D210_9PROT|nr:glycerophosphodiester phosphodiesterase family protein [Kordiimonas pumila]